MNRAHNLKILLLLAIGVLAMLALPGVAAAKHRDRNHDRIPDRWEKRHHLSLRVNQAGRDQDRDQLQNKAEFMAGDNPRNADSDGDGTPDGEENAGTIQSFDAETGRLTIDLFGTETVSGLVNDETEIECDHEGSPTSASASDSNEEENGDDKGGQGEEEPGDDEGGQGEEEPGDDEGDERSDDDGNKGPGGEDGGNCTAADLVAGAVVHEAELQIENGSATFEKVELAG